MNKTKEKGQVKKVKQPRKQKKREKIKQWDRGEQKRREN